MISSGDNYEINISGAAVKVDRVWGSGVRTCGTYWIGHEKVGYFVLPGFSADQGGGSAQTLVGGVVICEVEPKDMVDAMSLIEKSLRRNIEMGAYGKESLKKFQQSPYFNRGEMPVVFEME